LFESGGVYGGPSGGGVSGGGVVPPVIVTDPEVTVIGIYVVALVTPTSDKEIGEVPEVDFAVK
jgi:hypothetical protein